MRGDESSKATLPKEDKINPGRGNSRIMNQSGVLDPAEL